MEGAQRGLADAWHASRGCEVWARVRKRAQAVKSEARKGARRRVVTSAGLFSPSSVTERGRRIPGGERVVSQRRKGNSPLAGGTKVSAGQVERRGCAARSGAQAGLALPGRAGELGRARVIGLGLRCCVGWASSCGLG